MTTPSRDKLLRMDGWPGGVNNRVRETEQAVERKGETVPSSEFLRRALNVDLTAEGHPLRRQGYALHTAGYTHSAYGCNELSIFCVVIDGQLYTGPTPDELTAVASVNKYTPMEYCFVNDSIIYSNGQVIGEINYAYGQRDLTVPVAPKPTVSGGTEQQPEGYDEVRLVSVTYVDTYGREGGASEPVYVPGDGSFTVTVPTPLPDGISKVQVYASQVNGEILYHVQNIIATSTITVYPTDIGSGKELETLNRHPTLPGQIVRHMNGRLYVARNQKIIFSDPLRPHLTRPSQGIYMLPEYITLMEPSGDGLYVGTSKGVVYIGGKDPYDVTQSHVSPYAPVERAVTQIPGEKFGLSEDEVPVWWGTDGVMVVGLPDGELKQLTRDRLSIPAFQAGAVSLREYEGMSHVVSSLQRGDEVNVMGATDTVVAEVRQYNIVLNS